MLFTNPTFYFLVTLVLATVYVTPWAISRWLMILASYFFYAAAEPWYCLILLTSTLVDFFAAQRIAVRRDKAKFWLWFSLITNLGLLAVFKYADFTITNLNILAAWFGANSIDYLNLLLPIGISFYTFQTLSYTIDVYRGKQQPEKDFATFALYVAFFPQLVAGPIERAKDLLPQLRVKPKINREDLEYGFQRILWGLTKKLVFADRLAVTVNLVFSNPSNYSGAELALATVCFAFQLYLDFSAYTDIAIGVARLFGIRLSENFNYPFLCRNPSDFWSRWHMTLTNWFRDYLYAALGGTRRSSALITCVNLMIVMSVMGLWHGAAWNYVVFGFLSGLLLITYMIVRVWIGKGKRKDLFGNYWWSTPLAIVCANIAIWTIMIFFRADSLPSALTVISGIVSKPWTLKDIFYVPLVVVSLAMVAHIVLGSLKVRIHDFQLSPITRASMWLVLLCAINFFAIDYSERFIYFQF